MKKLLLLAVFVILGSITYSQDIAISFYQGGVLCEGRTLQNKYLLGCQNVVCTFDASYRRCANGTIIMNVYNPNMRGFVPATYYIYPNNTLDVFVGGYRSANGWWQTITTGDGSTFRSTTTFVKTKYKCSHCSCSGYWGYKHQNGTYEGKCSNTDKWGHTCGHGPEQHGLRKW